MGNDLKLRKAGLEDCEDILAWRNDPISRKNSFNSEAISYTDHQHWFDRTLRNEKKLMFIAEDLNSNKLGIVRLDCIDNGLYEVNVNLSPEYRGKSWGNKILKEASKLVKGKLVARIKSSNVASIRAFQNCGYILKQAADEIIEMEYISK